MNWQFFRVCFVLSVTQSEWNSIKCTELHKNTQNKTKLNKVWITNVVYRIFKERPMAFTHLNSTRSDDILRSTETLHANSFQTYLFWRRNTCWLDVATTHRACVLNICCSCEHVYLYCTVGFFCVAKHYMIRLFLQPMSLCMCVRSSHSLSLYESEVCGLSMHGKSRILSSVIQSNSVSLHVWMNESTNGTVTTLVESSSFLYEQHRFFYTYICIEFK